ncbi:MAG: ABC transporter permease [Endomicrobium sp.]|jgi:ABC-2 type transport system permease protein|uniref:ABC transporter permease n=1 Tax=Candidatus Endomicrobiellum cubanum TaxID=3242325 RepID=UPI002824AA85|nr:ABC transporter permease [Endomicrobium sp.]
MKTRILKGFIKKELIQIFRDKKMIAALFFLPVLQTIMFGFALKNEVKNIKFTIFAKPSDYIARKIQKKAISSGYFKYIDNINSMDFSNVEKTITSKKVEAVLVAPKENFANAIDKGKPIQLLIDATNAARARQIEVYIKAITLDVIRGYKQNSNANNFITLDTRILYNHTLDTASFMIPAITVMSTFIVAMLICCMSITKEKEQGTIEKLISSPVTSLEIILGKTLPYAIIGVLIICFIIFIGTLIFNVPLRGYFWQILITGILFIWTALSLAIIVSIAAKSQQQAMIGCFIILLPSILLSGILFPVENISSSIRWICYLNPIMYAASNLRNIMLKGNDLLLFWQYCCALFLIALTISMFSIKKFKSTLN